MPGRQKDVSLLRCRCSVFTLIPSSAAIPAELTRVSVVIEIANDGYKQPVTHGMPLPPVEKPYPLILKTERLFWDIRQGAFLVPAQNPCYH